MKNGANVGARIASWIVGLIETMHLKGTLSGGKRETRGAPSTLAGAILCLCAVALMTVATPSKAAARQQSSIVIDSLTGRTLFADEPDAECYPASLTKVMTLYMLFTELEAGRLKLNSPLHVSQTAASREPSKLYLKPGTSIQVEDAILALVTKSANDVAAVIGENLAGSEPAFGREMTKMARSIGMSRTTFRNASGLPDSQQVTTARDMATLAKRVQEDFPQYFHYFSATRFVWQGRTIGNHNRLLYDYRGTTGLKTGYTRASGYNLTATVERDDRELIGVVMGSSSSRARNAEMMRILDKAMGDAVPARTIATRIGTVAVPEDANALTFAQGIEQPKTTLVASAQPSSVDPRPAPAATLASLAPASSVTETPNQIRPSKRDVASTKNVAKLEVQKAQVVTPKVSETVDNKPVSVANLAPRADQSSGATNSVASASKPAQGLTSLVAARSLSNNQVPADSWIIQIGAFSQASGAEGRIQDAIAAAPSQLTRAVPVTVPVKSGTTTLYRARFGGFTNEAQARSACGQLTRVSISCIAIPPSAWEVPRRTASLQ